MRGDIYGTHEVDITGGGVHSGSRPQSVSIFLHFIDFYFRKKYTRMNEGNCT